MPNTRPFLSEKRQLKTGSPAAIVCRRQRGRWWLPNSLPKITHCHCPHCCVGGGSLRRQLWSIGNTGSHFVLDCLSKKINWSWNFKKIIQVLAKGFIFSRHPPEFQGINGKVKLTRKSSFNRKCILKSLFRIKCTRGSETANVRLTFFLSSEAKWNIPSTS
jgi:hypothetical protein